MRKKLDTRFPAPRIKKIMQADEDVGKIALAVPVLVSKALELFLQDLCDRTYEVTLQRGAKTISTMHLKQCVQSYNVFDFLRDIVSRVPDYGHGHGHADAASDDRTVSRRRKAVGDDGNDTDEESKKSRTLEMGHGSSSGRGRGRGRGIGRGRGAKTVERESLHQEIEPKPPSLQPVNVNKDYILGPHGDHASELKESVKSNPVPSNGTNLGARNFDLNAQIAGNETSAADAAPAASSPPGRPNAEDKHEDYLDWPLSEVDKMAIDPLQLTNLRSRIDEEEEDYDEES